MKSVLLARIVSKKVAQKRANLTRSEDKIFQPFYTTKEKGVGLGLVLCKEIMMRHNGAISFTSEEAKGATFTVELPVGSFETL